MGVGADGDGLIDRPSRVGQLGAAAGNQDGVEIPKARSDFQPSGKGVSENDDGPTLESPGNPLGFAEHETVDATGSRGLLFLSSRKEREQPFLKGGEIGLKGEFAGGRAVLKNTCNGGEGVEVAAHVLCSKKQKYDANLPVIVGAVVREARGNPANGDNVAALEWQADMGKGDTAAEVGCHRPFPVEKEVEQLILPDLAHFLDVDAPYQFAEGLGKTSTFDLKDPISCDKSVEPHRTRWVGLATSAGTEERVDWGEGRSFKGRPADSKKNFTAPIR